MLIEMKVAGVMVDPVNLTPIVALKDSENKYTLPIWVGVSEASAIMMEMEGIKPPRPYTHDLLRNVFNTLGVIVTKVEITELKDNTYYAIIFLRAGDLNISSILFCDNIIALALRMAAPIFVEKSVIDKSIESIISASTVSDVNPEEKKKTYDELLKHFKNADFGKYKM
ncbi:MAG: bifunctional nuclease family protein [Deltaproteobacteria bacterium]|nr:bifunctional nuclease family protein [Deltaproteobacteria bacterium]